VDRKYFPTKPNPATRVQSEKGAERQPRGNGRELKDRNIQQPIKRDQIVGQSGDVAEPKGALAINPKGDSEKSSRGNIAKTGNTEFGKGGSEQKTGEDREWNAFSDRELCFRIAQAGESLAKRFASFEF
jgi:hypothetical protein